MFLAHQDCVMHTPTLSRWASAADQFPMKQLELELPGSVALPVRRQSKRSAMLPTPKAGGRAKRLRRAAATGFGAPVVTCDLRWSQVREAGTHSRRHRSERATFVHADAAPWMTNLPDNSIHAVVTDPPYGVVEYNGLNQEKLRAGRGGVWRIPPSFDGAKRNP